jgi:hypothetical protein
VRREVRFRVSDVYDYAIMPLIMGASSKSFVVGVRREMRFRVLDVYDYTVDHDSTL